ncbi:MAG: GNAT family N-acetyltransferase [Acetobacteraceae bacterium]
MAEPVDLIFEPLPSVDLLRLLEDNLVNHAIARTGQTEWFPVNYFLRSRIGEWLGGCSGHVWGQWLQIRLLWVTDSLQGLGYGTKLMDAAESYALERGAGAATLETHSYQAKDFYLKRGYEIFGTLADYPPGHQKYFLRKSLRRPLPTAGG